MQDLTSPYPRLYTLEHFARNVCWEGISNVKEGQHSILGGGGDEKTKTKTPKVNTFVHISSTYKPRKVKETNEVFFQTSLLHVPTKTPLSNAYF